MTLHPAGRHAWLLVPPATLALGVVTSFGQTYRPDAIAPLFNSATSWSVIAFVAAFAARRPSRAALLGAASFAMLLVGYYATSSLRGYPVGLATTTMWIAATVVVGPVLGVSAAWFRSAPRGRRDVRGWLAVVPLGSIAMVEAIYGILVVSDTTPVAYWWTQLALGAAFVVIAPALRARRNAA
jgi:Family of unknown function (DUF6518)